MTFLNGILLLGATAVSIPFLVHLFNKNRYRTLKWGAMHLITSTTIVQKRRLKVENWFLMLLRMMILLFLAICLAHPQVIDPSRSWYVHVGTVVHVIPVNNWMVAGLLGVLLIVAFYLLISSRAPAVAWLFCLVIFALPGWLTFQLVAYDGKGTFRWGDTEMSVVLVMDDSYSLEYQDASGKPFDKGRDMAVKLVGDLRKGSDVQVIRMPGGAAYSKPRKILANVKEDLKEMEAGYGQADPAQAMRTISGPMGLGRMAHAQREVVVVTDFQKVSWGSNQVAALKDELKDFNGSRNPPQITMIHVGQGKKDNLAVMSLEYDPKLPLALKQELRVRA